MAEHTVKGGISGAEAFWIAFMGERRQFAHHAAERSIRDVAAALERPLYVVVEPAERDVALYIIRKRIWDVWHRILQNREESDSTFCEL